MSSEANHGEPARDAYRPDPISRSDHGAQGAHPSAMAVLERRLADTERRRIAAEVRAHTLEEERAKLLAESRERVGLNRRVERLRDELVRQQSERESIERELSESRFRMVEQESTVGALRTAEQRAATLEQIVDRLAGRLAGIADGSQPISRRGLTHLVEALKLDPDQALEHLIEEGCPKRPEEDDDAA